MERPHPVGPGQGRETTTDDTDNDTRPGIPAVNRALHQAQRVSRLADAFRRDLRNGVELRYEVSFSPELIRTATGVGFDPGWEPETIMAAVLQVRGEQP
jgi:hypothetical protein